MRKYILKDMVVGEILEGNYNIIKEEIKERKKCYKNAIVKKEKNDIYILKKGTEKNENKKNL